MKGMWHIYKKETREMMRDKRVRSAALFMPMILVFGILMLFGFLTNTIAKPENLKLHCVNASHPLAEALKKGKVTIIPIESTEVGEKMIREGKAKLVLVFPKDKDINGVIRIEALYDKKEERANVSLAQVQGLFRESGKLALEQILVAKGLPKEVAEPIKIDEKPIVIGSPESANSFLVQLLPYMIVIYAFYGAMGIVSDLVAGEKEKLTLETLLISPVSRVEIALGKFLALAQVSLISSVSALLGVVICGVANLPITRLVFANGLGLTIESVLVTILALIPTAGFFSGIMLAVSTYAKNSREAQTYLTLLSTVILIPAMMSQVIGYLDFANTLGMYFIPVLNTSAVIRSALQGKVEALPVIITIVISLGLALVSMLVAVRLFKREEVLIRV